MNTLKLIPGPGPRHANVITRLCARLNILFMATLSNIRRRTQFEITRNYWKILTWRKWKISWNLGWKSQLKDLKGTTPSRRPNQTFRKLDYKRRQCWLLLKLWLGSSTISVHGFDSLSWKGAFLGWRLRMHSSRSMLLPIIKTIEDLQLLSDAPAHRSFVCWLPPITCYHCELTWIGFLDRILVSILFTFIDGLRRERYRGSLHFIAKLTLSLDESSKPEKECPDLLSILSIPLFPSHAYLSTCHSRALHRNTFSSNSPTTLIERTKNTTIEGPKSRIDVSGK